MAGHGGNPNHDPKTGKFVSGAGFNRTNSTSGQRVVGHAKSLGRFGVNLARGAAVGAVEAVAEGVHHTLKVAAAEATADLITRYSPPLAAHGARVAAAAVSHASRAGSSTVQNVGAAVSSLSSRVGALVEHVRGQHRRSPMAFHDVGPSVVKTAPPQRNPLHEMSQSDLKSRPVTNHDGRSTSKMSGTRKKR